MPDDDDDNNNNKRFAQVIKLSHYRPHHDVQFTAPSLVVTVEPRDDQLARDDAPDPQTTDTRDDGNDDDKCAGQTFPAGSGPSIPGSSEADASTWDSHLVASKRRETTRGGVAQRSVARCSSNDCRSAPWMSAPAFSNSSCLIADLSRNPAEDTSSLLPAPPSPNASLASLWRPCVSGPLPLPLQTSALVPVPLPAGPVPPSHSRAATATAASPSSPFSRPLSPRSMAVAAPAATGTSEAHLLCQTSSVVASAASANAVAYTASVPDPCPETASRAADRNNPLAIALVKKMPRREAAHALPASSTAMTSIYSSKSEAFGGDADSKNYEGPTRCSVDGGQNAPVSATRFSSPPSFPAGRPLGIMRSSLLVPLRTQHFSDTSDDTDVASSAAGPYRSSTLIGAAADSFGARQGCCHFTGRNWANPGSDHDCKVDEVNDSGGNGSSSSGSNTNNTSSESDSCSSTSIPRRTCRTRSGGSNSSRRKRSSRSSSSSDGTSCNSIEDCSSSSISRNDSSRNRVDTNIIGNDYFGLGRSADSGGTSSTPDEQSCYAREVVATNNSFVGRNVDGRNTRLCSSAETTNIGDAVRSLTPTDEAGTINLDTAPDNKGSCSSSSSRKRLQWVDIRGEGDGCEQQEQLESSDETVSDWSTDERAEELNKSQTDDNPAKPPTSTSQPPTTQLLFLPIHSRNNPSLTGATDSPCSQQRSRFCECHSGSYTPTGATAAAGMTMGFAGPTNSCNSNNSFFSDDHDNHHDNNYDRFALPSPPALGRAEDATQSATAFPTKRVRFKQVDSSCVFEYEKFDWNDYQMYESDDQQLHSQFLASPTSPVQQLPLSPTIRKQQSSRISPREPALSHVPFWELCRRLAKMANDDCDGADGEIAGEKIEHFQAREIVEVVDTHGGNAKNASETSSSYCFGIEAAQENGEKSAPYEPEVQFTDENPEQSYCSSQASIEEPEGFPSNLE